MSDGSTTAITLLRGPPRESEGEVCVHVSSVYPEEEEGKGLAGITHSHTQVKLTPGWMEGREGGREVVPVYLYKQLRVLMYFQ